MNTNNTEYEYKNHQTAKNTNTQNRENCILGLLCFNYNRNLEIKTLGEIYTIRFPNFNRIRIRIIFGFEKSPEYEYEYYSVLKNHPNTNTNIIRFENISRIRIRISLFGLNYSNIIRIPNYSLTSVSIETNLTPF